MMLKTHYLRGRPKVERRSTERGLTLIDMMVAGAVLAIGVLGYASAAVSAQRLTRDETSRGVALVTLQRFVERMRADDDWAGLYGRLKARSVESANDPARTHLDADASLPTYAPTDYYADFTVPSTLGTVTVLVQVPTFAVGGTTELHEDLAAPRYGLPFDLNGDGAIDATRRDADYRALPCVVRLRWQRAGQRPDEVVAATWLRKDG